MRADPDVVIGTVRRGEPVEANRSRFMTLSQAATKSFTNFSFASSLA
ncbi:hypothetical protein QBA35_41270 [Streptomyces bottropensis]|uniref:Uncharacterized protein n=1 Tax=Streptomyces bottropensis TaxID=42235 RepID=A0ABU8B0X4_9ACTN